MAFGFDRRGGRFGEPRHALKWFMATPSGVLRAAPDLQNFVQNLIDANAEEIQEYATEIVSEKEFYKHLEGNRSNFGGRPFLSWGRGIGTTLGTVLYALCRKLKPDAVVETGVASGVSSAYILSALEQNKHGELYSIDLPWGETMTYPKHYFAPEGVGRVMPRREQSGWIIPDYLRHRWELVPGRSSEKLPPLLEKLGAIDIFLHDSEHSYQNMLWEYQTAWVYLKGGGILLSHNVDDNDAFSHFCQSVRVKGFLLANMGGAVKS